MKIKGTSVCWEIKTSKVAKLVAAPHPQGARRRGRPNRRPVRQDLQVQGLRHGSGSDRSGDQEQPERVLRQRP